MKTWIKYSIVTLSIIFIASKINAEGSVDSIYSSIIQKILLEPKISNLIKGYENPVFKDQFRTEYFFLCTELVCNDKISNREITAYFFSRESLFFYSIKYFFINSVYKKTVNHFLIELYFVNTSNICDPKYPQYRFIITCKIQGDDVLISKIKRIRLNEPAPNEIFSQ